MLIKFCPALSVSAELFIKAFCQFKNSLNSLGFFCVCVRVYKICLVHFFISGIEFVAESPSEADETQMLFLIH